MAAAEPSSQTNADVPIQPRQIKREHLSLNLNEYNGLEFKNYIFSFYQENPAAYIDLRFNGVYNFRVGVAEMLILFIVNNQHKNLVKTLNAHPRKFKHVRPNTTTTYILFRHRRGPLFLNDFLIFEQIWPEVHDIKTIRIVSHNITFTRSSPQRLQDICLYKLDARALSSLPTHVVKRLEDSCLETLKQDVEDVQVKEAKERKQRETIALDLDTLDDNKFVEQPCSIYCSRKIQVRVFMGILIYLLLEFLVFLYKLFFGVWL